MSKNLITWWQSLSQVAKHVVMAIAVILLVVLTGLGCGNFARYESRTWLCQYDSQIEADCASLVNSPGWLRGWVPAWGSNTAADPRRDATNTNANAASPAQNTQAADNTATPSPTPAKTQAKGTPTPTPVPPPPPLTEQQRTRLDEQGAKVKGLIRHHGRVMAFFFEAYYTSICVLLFGGAVVAVAVFFIAMSGWALANQYLKNLFVVMSAAVAFYALWPPVFQQEKNISDNRALFLEYEILQNEIASYPVTRSTIKNEHKEPNDFINYVDSELARIGNIAIGFDYTKVTYKGAFENNPSSSPPPAGAQPKKTP